MIYFIHTGNQIPKGLLQGFQKGVSILLNHEKYTIHDMTSTGNSFDGMPKSKIINIMILMIASGNSGE